MRRQNRRLRVYGGDAGKRVRRAHDTGIGLIGQRNVGHEPAAAANEYVVLEARFAARATLCFCIHGLFGNALFCDDHAPYNEIAGR
jgi:hypothetical protein